MFFGDGAGTWWVAGPGRRTAAAADAADDRSVRRSSGCLRYTAVLLHWLLDGAVLRRWFLSRRAIQHVMDWAGHAHYLDFLALVFLPRPGLRAVVAEADWPAGGRALAQIAGWSGRSRAGRPAGGGGRIGGRAAGQPGRRPPGTGWNRCHTVVAGARASVPRPQRDVVERSAAGQEHVPACVLSGGYPIQMDSHKWVNRRKEQGLGSTETFQEGRPSPGFCSYPVGWSESEAEQVVSVKAWDL